MSYVVVEVNADINVHWGALVLEIQKHHHGWAGKLENAHIDKVFEFVKGPGHVFYQFHIKSGHFPHHHQFTVLAETHHGHYTVLNIVEGHNTLF